MSQSAKAMKRKLERLELIRERHRKLILEPRGRVIMEEAVEEVEAVVDDEPIALGADVDLDIDVEVEEEAVI